MLIQRGLLGGYAFCREWGRIGPSAGTGAAPWTTLAKTTRAAEYILQLCWCRLDGGSGSSESRAPSRHGGNAVLGQSKIIAD
nr:WGR domain-containing protein [Thioalkalivibrio sp. AKL12]